MSRIARCIAPALIILLLITPVIAVKYDKEIDVTTVGKIKFDISDKIYFKPDKTAEDLTDNDLCVYDKKKFKIKIISSDKFWNKGNKYSDYLKPTSDNKKAVFHSWSDNLVDVSVIGCNVYLKDLESGEIQLISTFARMPTMSDDGRFIVYEYEDNFADDQMPMLQLYDTVTKTKLNLAFTSSWNGGWKTQEFRIENNVIYFVSSYYKNTFRNYTYEISTGIRTEVS